MLTIYRAVRKFEQDVRLWRLLPRKALVIMSIPLVIMLAMVALVPISDVFVWITAEDSLMESIQLLLLGAGLIFARLGLMLIRDGQREGLLCLLVALAIFFVAGEEVAWGQRFLGWETPEKLKAINYQNETTLHNIGPAHQLSIYAVMLGGLYGSIIPLFTLSKRAERACSTLRYLLIPPLCLVPSFIMPFGYRLSRLLFPLEEWFPHLIFHITKFSEVTELCLYFGLFSFAWLNLARFKREELKI